jgi:hypothetical protein
MRPIKFPEVNVTFAENQPEYQPLPALREPDGAVTSCWRLGWRERFEVLFSGKLWITALTFNGPPQPIMPRTRVEIVTR